MSAKMIPGGLYTQAGLPIPNNGKYSEPAATTTDINPLKCGMYNIFADVDKADAINRYVWHNLPEGLTSQLIETVLYHRGQGIFFYLEELDKFFFLPYTLDAKDGTGIDPYGRFLQVTPIPLAGGTVDKDGNAEPWIPGTTFNVLYDIVLPEDLTYDHLIKSAVIIRDYTPAALTQTCIPRAAKQLPFFDIMSDCVPLLRTALINGVGVTGIKVQNADEQANVDIANRQVQNAALNGQRYISMINKLDTQEIADARGAADTENYMRALLSIDNLRLSSYGIENGGVFQKASHMLQTEQDMASGAIGLVMQDGLELRQYAANIINSVWGLAVWPEVSETVSGLDKNMDGEISDSRDPMVFSSPNPNKNENENGGDEE